jgi:hypothetical protein
LKFYENNAGTLKELSFCGSPPGFFGSPLVSRQGSGACILNLAAHVKVIGDASAPDYIETFVSNDTDEHFPPGCGQVVWLPLYKVPESSALHNAMLIMFGASGAQCEDVFYTRGPDVNYPPLQVNDMQKTQSPLSAFDKVTLPILWVSHRENPAWFPPGGEEQKDSSNVYSSDHPASKSHSPPVTYGADKGTYYPGCNADLFRKWNYIPDIKLGGFAYIYAWVYLTDKEADIGVQSEADLLFINAHFSTQQHPVTGWQYFHRFYATAPGQAYPGSDTSIISEFKWSDLSGNFTDDCDWIATTGCESLNWHPNGLVPAVHLIKNGYLVSIAGFHYTDNQEDNYRVISHYDDELASCDGSFNPDFWDVAPLTNDCNVISWMEAFCEACRGDWIDEDYPDGIFYAQYARAVDVDYVYDIHYPLTAAQRSAGVLPAKNDIYIVYSNHGI